MFANSVAATGPALVAGSPRLVTMSDSESMSVKRPKLRQIISGLIGFLIVGSVAAAALWPSSYLIEKPGPVYNVLSTSRGVPIIKITNKESFPTDGDLDLLTITFGQTAPNRASWLDVAMSYLDPSLTRVEYDSIYPPNVDSSQVEQQAQVMMLDSQANAKAAALKLLGIPYTTEVKVTAITKNAPATGKLFAGDTVLTVNGEKAIGLDQVRSMVEASKGKTPVVFEIVRNGSHRTVSILPKLSDGKWRVGMYVASVPEFPFKIDILLQSVSGPSGGQIFALAIYDKLTPGSLTGGNKIAGTGTVDPDGTIGAIGGIKSKMYGALRSGAKYFLAPSVNCEDVVGNVPDGLQVIKVANLKDSLNALKAIREGNQASLPTCTK